MSIPRIVHFIFGLKPQTSPLHLAHYLSIRSCLEINNPQQVIFHYGNEPFGPLWNDLKPHLTLRPITAPDPLQSHRYPAGSPSTDFRYAHTSDFLRLQILLREGGLYADIDTLFIAPIPEHLYRHPFVLGHETVDPHVASASLGGSLCNALILSQPGAAFGKLWLDRMATTFDGSWSRHSTFLPYELSLQHPEDLHVEPTSSFFHLDWTPNGLQRLFLRSETLPPTVYSLHLWAHLWWDRTRTDFSRFHAGLLTPQYVAHADTTYARYARPFLPPGLDIGSALAFRLTQTLHHAHDLAARVSARFTPPKPQPDAPAA